MVLTRAQNQPGAGRRPGHRATTCRMPPTPTPRTWTSPRPTPPTPPTRCSCASTSTTPTASRSPPASCSAARRAHGAGGMATWADVKEQAADLLGLKLTDKDVLNIPQLAVDPYGKFIPGPARGLPQYVTADRAGRGRHRRHPVPGAGERAVLRHPVPDGHRAQRRPEPAGHATTTRPRRRWPRPRTPTPRPRPISPASRPAPTTTRC